MSPVPPATSMHFIGAFLPGRNVDTNVSFHNLWTPKDVASFIRSYFEATESKTFLTKDSFASSGTVLKPNDVVRVWGSDGGAEGGICEWLSLVDTFVEHRCRRGMVLLKRCISLAVDVEQHSMSFFGKRGYLILPLSGFSFHKNVNHSHNRKGKRKSYR